MGERHVARHRHVAATDEADVGDGVVRRPEGTTVATAARAPVRPATRWMHVVSRASVRLTAGTMVVSRRASLDVPTPGGRARGHYGHNACIAFTFTPKRAGGQFECARSSLRGETAWKDGFTRLRG
jgi:hypothetical protein